MPGDHCDHCDKPAIVHELRIKNGVTVEVHLCEEHAAQQGYAMPTNTPVHQLLTKLALSSGAKEGHGPGEGAGQGSGDGSKESRAKTVKVCPTCKRTIAKIKESGLLGCADCCRTFEENLQSLIERAQAGANFHLGRSPCGARDAASRHELRSRLVRELDEAVTAEQYERAAKLRDRIHELSRGAEHAE